VEGIHYLKALKKDCIKIIVKYDLRYSDLRQEVDQSINLNIEHIEDKNIVY
jgi:hypothetical protein